MEVFVDRLEKPFIIYDDETKERVLAIKNLDAECKIEVSRLLASEITPVEQVSLDPDEIAYMTHTSGTTGIPKLICHSYHSMGWRTVWQRTVFTKIAEKKLVAFHISPVHSRFNIGVSSLS